MFWPENGQGPTVILYSDNIQIPRSVDDIKKIVQQLDELTKKIEDAKDLAMVIYLC